MHQDADLFLNGLEATSRDVPVMNVIDKWSFYNFSFERNWCSTTSFGENLDSRLAVLRTEILNFSLNLPVQNQF